MAGGAEVRVPRRVTREVIGTERNLEYFVELEPELIPFT